MYIYGYDTLHALSQYSPASFPIITYNDNRPSKKRMFGASLTNITLQQLNRIEISPHIMPSENWHVLDPK